MFTFNLNAMLQLPLIMNATLSILNLNTTYVYIDLDYLLPTHMLLAPQLCCTLYRHPIPSVADSIHSHIVDSSVPLALGRYRADIQLE